MITTELIEHIDKWVKESIDKQPAYSFEVSHYHDVRYYTEQLADERQLDMSLSVVIAMLHDIGRIKLGYSGKAHAEFGSRLAQEYLTDLIVEQETVSVITNAIRNHRRKKKIHDIYDELIKDADALAHRDEFGYEALEYEEQYRCDLAFGETTASYSDVYGLRIIIKKKLCKLVEWLSNRSIDKLSKKEIHKLRVKIRTLRTLIWLYRQISTQEEPALKKLNKLLKDIFKSFEGIRALQVYYEIACDEPALSKYRDKVDALIKREKKALKAMSRDSAIVKRISKYCETLTNVRFMEDEIQEFDVLIGYTKLLQEINYEEIISLHDLRIYGKKLKYLAKSGVLKLSDDMEKQVSLLHESLGHYHDLHEFEVIIMVGAPDSDIRDMALIKKQQLKLIKKQLLKMHLMLR